MLHFATWCYMLHGAICYMLHGATWCYMLHGALNCCLHMVLDKFAKYYAFRVESSKKYLILLHRFDVNVKFRACTYNELCNVEERDGIFGCLGGWGEGCITALYVSLPAGCKPGDSRI